MEEKEIGSFFKDNLEDISLTPSGKVWENIWQDERVRKYNQRQARNKTITLGAGITLLIIGIIVGSYFVMKDNAQVPEIGPKIVVAENDSLKKVSEQEVFPDALIPETNTNTHSPTKVSNTDISNQEKTKVDSKLKSNDPVRVTTQIIPKSAGNMPSLIVDPTITVPISEAHVAEITTEDVDANEQEIEEWSFDDGAIPEEDENVLTGQEEVQKLPIPNAFTPNADGLNDRFVVNISNMDISAFEMMIFNRNGQLLFKTQSAESGWDGTHNGQLMPHGAYVYRITYKDKNGKRLQEQGTVILVR